MTLIMGGTLDDASWLKPTVQLFCNSGQPWISIPAYITKLGECQANTFHRACALQPVKISVQRY